MDSPLTTTESKLTADNAEQMAADARLAGQNVPGKAQADLFDTEYLKTDLKGRSVRGGAITVFSQGCKFALKTGSTVVLARILTPADFGLIAMVTAVTNFAMMFRELGLSTATVQKAEINHDQVSTLFWVNVAMGIIVAAIVVALAPAVAWFYDDPRLTPVTMALGAAFVFGGLTVQHQAMLQRHMRFFAIGIVEIVSMALAVAAAIIAGLLGAGYWALVIMHVTLALATAVGKWIAFPWLPGRPKKGVGVREMLGFGGNITGFNIINYFYRNADNILIGKFLGATALGFYTKAYGLLMLPINQLRNPINSVAIPSLSRLQSEPERFRKYYSKVISVIALITMPLMVYLAIYAEDVIRLVLGQQWLPAVSIFRILAVAAVIQPVSATKGLIFVSLGQGARYLRFGLINAICMVVAFIIGIHWGTIGVAYAYTIASYLVLLPLLWYCFRYSPVSIIDFFQAIGRPITASIITGLVIWWLYKSIVIDEPVIVLGIGLLATVVTYLLIWLFMPGGRKTLTGTLSYLKEIKMKKSKRL